MVEVDLSENSIRKGNMYKFTFHPKKAGAAGDHGIFFGFNTKKFQAREQITINFYDLISLADHNQNAVCNLMGKTTNIKD